MIHYEIPDDLHVVGWEQYAAYEDHYGGFKIFLDDQTEKLIGVEDDTVLFKFLFPGPLVGMVYETATYNFVER